MNGHEIKIQNVLEHSITLITCLTITILEPRYQLKQVTSWIFERYDLIIGHNIAFRSFCHHSRVYLDFYDVVPDEASCS